MYKARTEELKDLQTVNEITCMLLQIFFFTMNNTEIVKPQLLFQPEILQS